MILQSLYDYYQRKSADLAPSGWEWKEIPFVLVVDAEGMLVKIEDRRDEKGKRAMPSLVPQAVKRANNVAANLLWDNAEYVLGYIAEGKKADRIADQHQAFIDKIREYFPDPAVDKAVAAVLTFFASNPLGQATARPEWQEVLKAKNANFAFQLDGKVALVHELSAIRNIINAHVAPQDHEGQLSLCLITGKEGEIARLHPPVKGVFGTQTMGGNIVSFNLDAFRSYGKHQGDNAPVSEEAANTYTTALNYLLRKDSPQKLQLGDTTTTVWWADKPGSNAEETMGFCFGGLGRDDPDRRSEVIKGLVNGVWKGNLNNKDADNNRFYILGLAPNAARIAIRFFDVYTVENFGENIARYFQDISLPYFAEHHYPPLPGICAAITATGKTDQLPQNFPGEMFYRIVKGLPYPKLWFHGAIRRARATQDVTTYLAAIVKACLIRNYHKEVSMTVDDNNRETGYLLGRLFAVYDKLKEDETTGSANRRDRFFSAVSSRPRAVFFRIAQLAEHDLRKLRRSNETRGLAMVREKQILQLQSLIGQPLTHIPSSLDVEQQAWFVLGFYHQRQEFFTPKHKENTEQKDAA